MPPINLAADLELFFGDAHPAETRVYARLAGIGPGEGGWKLSGTLTGPYCTYAQTLPATMPLVDLGPGDALLAQVVVPDPCFWTPELPFLYRAQVELHHGSGVLAVMEFPWGIRPLGGRGRRFYYEGKPWVLRGVYRVSATLSELPEFHAADAAIFVENPDDEFCTAASEQGVLIVARLNDASMHAPADIRRLARHAAVGFIVLDGDVMCASDPRTLARNVLFVHPSGPGAALQTPLWASSILCPQNLVHRLVESAVPTIVFRAVEGTRSIAACRKLCDVLQRDLAGRGEIAGYLV